jgi:hypothetical protein
MDMENLRFTIANIRIARHQRDAVRRCRESACQDELDLRRNQSLRQLT